MQESRRDLRAMGSECSLRVVVDDDRAEPLLDRAEELLLTLERRWSRFLPDSELSRLNAHAGVPVFTSAETFALVALAVEAWRVTDGRFDPTMLDTLVEAGYDATFDEVRDRGEHGVLDTAVPSSGGLGLVDLFARSHLVHAPAGLHLDLGGIGKGRAADLVAAQLLDDGAVGVCVDLGGDLRVAGSTADGSSWTVVVDDPFHPGADLMVLGVAAGAVTTSSTLRRRWVTPQGGAHHLLDPRTGRPVASGLASVTVLAAEAAWGEVHAKAALVAGAHEGRSLIERAGLSALFVHDDGRVDEVGGFDAFVVERSTGVDEGAGRR